MKTLSLADLHAAYQREHPKMDRRDKNNTAKAFSIIENMMSGLSVKTFGKMQFWHFRNELIQRDYSRNGFPSKDCNPKFCTNGNGI